MKNILTILMLLLVSLCSFGQLQQAEYFWDTDPGQGSGTSIQAADGTINDAIEELFKNGISSPSQGIHTFNIRTQDSSGVWSPVYTTIISVEGLINTNTRQLVNAEAFWDTDPGQGNGIAILAQDGSFDNVLEFLLKDPVQTGIGNGLHTFNIRVKDNHGNWGPKYSSVIAIDVPISFNARQLTIAEAFWDTDPGYGNGITILTVDGNFDNVIEQLLKDPVQTGVGGGVHTFNLRVKDNNGNWSPTHSAIVSVETIIATNDRKLVSAEVFWDSDPGQGNGIAILAQDGNFDDVIEHLLQNNLPANSGQHSFNLRVKDNNGTWGPVFSSVVSIEQGITVNVRQLTEGEAFWDTDPGLGNGISFVASDGNMDEVLEEIMSSSLNSNNLSLGFHQFSVRVKDNSGIWGPIFSSAVAVDHCPAPNLNIGNDTVLCSGNNISLSANAGFTNYQWSTGSTSNNISVGPGTYAVTATTNAGCERFDEITITANVAVDLGVDQSVCDGKTISISAGSNFNSYQWSNGASTSAVNVSGGTYTVTTIDAYGCVTDDQIVVSTMPKPNIDLGNDTTICQGETLVLSADPTLANYDWSTGSTNSSIIVNTPGTYAITVTTIDNCNNSDDITVGVDPLPVANYNYALNGNVLQLTNSSQFAANYVWNFGDGNNSSQNDPSHTFTASGNYNIQLKAYNDCGVDSMTQMVNVILVGITDLNMSNSVKVYPNPTSDILYIESITNSQEYQVELYSSLGQKLLEANGNDIIKIDLSQFNPGNYTLLCKEKGRVLPFSVVKIK